jgi:hypothetical protein
VINTNTKIVRNNEIISSDMDDETVMMNIEKGEYYGINPIGSRIWELIETPRKVSNICEKLCEEYDVTQEKCNNDVMHFLNHMAEKKIITIVD